jgi:hypothetical protein
MCKKMTTRNRTRTVLTLAVILGVFTAFSGSLQAGLLVYEPFDYPDAPLNGQGGALGTTGTWTTNDTGFEAGWWCHPEGELTGQFDDIGGGLNMFDGTVDNLSTSGGFVGSAGPEEQGSAFGTRDQTGNMDANIGLDPSVTATFQSGTTTWFSYVGAHADNRNQGSPTFMICTDPTVNGERGLTMQNSGNGIGGVGGPPRFNLQDVYPHYFSGGIHHQIPGGYLGGVFGAHDGIVTAFCSTSTCDGALDEEGQSRTQTMAWQISDDNGFGAPNIVVGKIEWDADTGGEDIISVVRFLETDTLSEAAFDALITALPALSSANWASNKPDLDQSQFDTLNLSGLKFYVDEIRIGTTFGDVAVSPAVVPVGYWKLDETSGAIAEDSSGNGHDGILSADPAPIWTTDPARGNVLEFVPGLDYVDCGPGVSAGQNLTVALWIKPADVELMRPISCFDGDDYSENPGWFLMLRHDDWGEPPQIPPNTWFRMTGTEGEWDSGDLWINECWAPGEWVHMAFTFDEDTDTLSGYINGQLAGITVVPEGRSVASDTNPLIMGHGGGVEQYEGLMDEVYIYDVVLTDAEIWNLVYPITITIDNPGFEDPVLGEDDWTWLDVPGWTQVGGEGPGIWHVTSADFDPVVAPEGQNVLYTENAVGDAGGVAQVLTETFAANTDYTLTVEVGNSYYYYNGGYSVQLLAGGVVIAEDNDTLWPEYYKWATSTVEYTYNPADAALVGQPLEIRLLNLALDKDNPPADEVVGVEFDNVSLSYVPAPPAPILLIEDFDSLAVGTNMHDVDGWEGWFGDRNAGARVTDAVAYSGTNSLEIVGNRDDLVRNWPKLTTGRWVLSVMQYCPSDKQTTGIVYFGILTEYDGVAGTKAWIGELRANFAAGKAYYSWNSTIQVDLVYDEWVELRLEVDLDAQVADFYYNNVFLATAASPVPSLVGVNIFPEPSIEAVYFDDLRIEAEQ